MFRITLYYPGVPEHVGIALCEDVLRDMDKRELDYRGMACTYANRTLTLVAESEIDDDGITLSAEFAAVIKPLLPTSAEQVEIGSVVHLSQ